MEIIPNWHPIFVHFTVGLFSIAVAFFFISYICAYIKRIPTIFPTEFEIVGRWVLWAVSLITIGTALAGLYAYNTVQHNEISHAMMTIHRNWALGTLTIILILGGWSLWNYYHRISLRLSFIVALFIGQILLLTTAWYGGEIVYRYGVGVISLPTEKEKMHHHEMSTQNTPHDLNEHMHNQSSSPGR